jgi:hypothetical protein
MRHGTCPEDSTLPLLSSIRGSSDFEFMANDKARSNIKTRLHLNYSSSLTSQQGIGHHAVAMKNDECPGL